MKLSTPALFASNSTSSSRSANARKKTVRLPQQTTSQHGSARSGSDELASAFAEQQQPTTQRMASTGERARPTTPGAAATAATWSRTHRHSDSHGHNNSNSTNSNSKSTTAARDQVVVGIAASLDDDVEDWTDDFMDSSRGADGTNNSERPRGGPDRVGDLATRFNSNFHHASSALQRATLRWHRQHSLDSNYSDLRQTFKAASQPQHSRSARQHRRSSGDAAAAAGDVDSTQRAPLSATAPSSPQHMLEPASSTDAAGLDADALAPLRGSSGRSSRRGSDAAAMHSNSSNVTTAASVSFAIDDDKRDSDSSATAATARPNMTRRTSSAAADASDDDEDWDVEFGFADASDDERADGSGTALTGSSSSAVDSTRRRSENFNIFLRNFHAMMDGDALSDDDSSNGGNSSNGSDTGRPTTTAGRHAHKRSGAPKTVDEPLFQRKRSEFLPSASVDGSVDGTLSRASLTSAPGSSSSHSIEFALIDKFRLLDVASSSAYAVRIERYPKPCSTFSHLEDALRHAKSFASLSEHALERWLATLVSSKSCVATPVLEAAREQLANPRQQQKNQQFRAFVALPFGVTFATKCFEQIAIYRFFGEDKSNRELVRVFFEKVSTTAFVDGDWTAAESPDDVDAMAKWTIEILQEAARLYGPQPPPVPTTPYSRASLSFSSTAATASAAAQTSSSATLFWMRQFQSILRICAAAFPLYRHVIALIELRYVCHHLVGFASGDFSHTWQVCNQLPAFCPMELIAGDAAPSIANEILEYYGALFMHLNTSAESRASCHSDASTTGITTSSTINITGINTTSEPSTVATAATATAASIAGVSTTAVGISPDAICLQALVLCDIQSLYESRSALADVAIPELSELFEFEDDDMNIDPRLMELLDTEAKVQSAIPGLYTTARTGVGSNSNGSSNNDDPSPPSRSPTERRNSSSGLGGWSTESRLLALLKPSSSLRLAALTFFYERIGAHTQPLVKAKCALMLGSMHHLAGSLANMRAAESLTYEAVRLLDACSSAKLAPFAFVRTDRTDSVGALCRSLFSNDGLLSELGREALEQFGNVLIKNHKYRYGVLALEAARALYGFLHQGDAYDRMDRLLCRVTLEADDVARALPLHEKVAASAQRQGNVTEFVYLTQALTNLWIREGHFARAEANLLAAGRVLREHSNVLPPSFLATLYSNAAGSSSSDSVSVGRSGTMLTTSTATTSSSMSGSFHMPSGARGHTSELDAWLTHDLSLHLLVRDVYRASGRYLEAMHVLHYVLSYSSRLPRGKRTQLQMLLAEDARKMRLLATCRQTLAGLDREANAFCERLKENILSCSTIGSSSGTNGGNTGTGSSSGGGRSMGGLGSEARYCFDMVFSLRYVLCRAKCHLAALELRDAALWLALAHVKSDKENVRTQAQLHVLDSRVFAALCREFYEGRRRRIAPRTSSASNPLAAEAMAGRDAAIAAEVECVVMTFAGSFYGLSTNEKRAIGARLLRFTECASSADSALAAGVDALWTAFDQFQALDDVRAQLKTLLAVVRLRVAPIAHAFFALGSNVDDDALKTHLVERSSLRRQSCGVSTPTVDSTDALPLGDDDDDDDDIIERTRQSLLDAQRLLRRAMVLAEQVADPAALLQTLIACSEVWLWLERLASYKNNKAVKEAAAFWDEAVKLLHAVFLRRVAFHRRDDATSGTGTGSSAGTYCVVPILNFSTGVIARLETMTLQLLVLACQLQQLERVPEYVDELVSAHLDELLSAKLCLGSVAQQLAAFREAHRSATAGGSSSSSAVTATPRSSVSGGGSSDSSTRAASFTSSTSASTLHATSNSSGGSAGTPSAATAAAGKRKGHKKNQSMSSISELLASSGSPTPSTSFHDISASFIGGSSSTNGSRSSSFLGTTATTPRTGLASLSERVAAAPHYKALGATGMHPPLLLRPHRSHTSVVRTRERSSSAPQPDVPTPPSSMTKLDGSSGELGDALPPVLEALPGGGESSTSSRRRIVDLADVTSWSSRDDLSTASDDQLDAQRHHRDDHRYTTTNNWPNDRSSSPNSNNNALGLYDFDEVQSERLWWIFNRWRDARTKYSSGKLETAALRTQNLRYLRTLLDAFAPHQVAVLYVSGAAGASVIPSHHIHHRRVGSGSLTAAAAAAASTLNTVGGIVGFDVAHIRAHALVQTRDLVLAIGYARPPAFKVFRVRDGDTRAWRSELPRPDWYLRHFAATAPVTDERDVAIDSSTCNNNSDPLSASALRTLRLLGPKVLVKLLGLLMLENAVVITGASFPQVQDVALSLIALLAPFRWPHTFVPFVPVTSWRFVFDALALFAAAQQAARPKTRTSFSRLSAEWRWGSSSSSSSASSAPAALSSALTGDASRSVGSSDTDEPPFLLGVTTETWQSCLQFARARSDDSMRTILSHVTVVDLDNLETFAIAKSSSANAVPLPRKWRKHFLERFERAVKTRRKVLTKLSRRLARSNSRSAIAVPSTPSALSTPSTLYGGGSVRLSTMPSPLESDDVGYRTTDLSSHRSYDDARSSRSASMWLANGDVGAGSNSHVLVASMLAAADAAGADDRRFYDAECYGAFVGGLRDFYDKVASLCDEKDKKLQGATGSKAGSTKKKSGLSKRHELRAWFSSSHDFDAFVDRFHDSEVYATHRRDVAEKAATAAAAAVATTPSVLTTRSSVFALLSVGSSGSGSAGQTLGGTGGSSSQLSRQLRSAGSMSSTSSLGMGG